MSLVEGARVSYVGDGEYDIEVGDHGKVLSSDGHASHVLWMTGSQQGNILFIDDFDLVVEGNQYASIEDSLDVGLVSFAVREVFDRYGQPGLFNSMNNEGHLSVFMPIAEEAIALVASRIREDPSFVEVLSHLDDEDADEFVFYATRALIKDAFGEEDI